MKRLAGCAAVPLAVWGVSIAARSAIARAVADRSVGRPVPLVSTAQVLDVGDGIWRGPAPDDDGYPELRAKGVATVVDLRTGAESARAAALARGADLTFVALPMEDGRSPDPEQYDRFAATLAQATGTVFVHCRAGEGRTGAIVGAHQVRCGAPRPGVVADALAVGSLTFSQLAFVVSAGRGRRLPRVLDLLVDRPTEFAFDVLRRRRDRTGS